MAFKVLTDYEQLFTHEKQYNITYFYQCDIAGTYGLTRK